MGQQLTNYTGKPIFTSWGFLSDERRVFGDAESLAERSLAILSGNASSYVHCFEACNLLSLALFRSGRLDEAKKLCKKELQWASRGKNSDKWPEILIYAIQPQINLLRIEGYTGSLDHALNGYDDLDKAVRSKKGALPSGPSSLADWDSIQRWDHLHTLVRDVLIADTCKMVMRRNRSALTTHAAMLRVRYHGEVVHAQHAKEAPWLLGEVDDPSISLDAVRRGTTELTPYVQLIHWVTHIKGSDQVSSVLTALAEAWPRPAPNLQEATAARIELALAELLLHSSRYEEADNLFHAVEDRIAHGLPDPSVLGALDALGRGATLSLQYPVGQPGSIDRALSTLIEHLETPHIQELS